MTGLIGGKAKNMEFFGWGTDTWSADNFLHTRVHNCTTLRCIHQHWECWAVSYSWINCIVTFRETAACVLQKKVWGATVVLFLHRQLEIIRNAELQLLSVELAKFSFILSNKFYHVSTKRLPVMHFLTTVREYGRMIRIYIKATERMFWKVHKSVSSCLPKNVE